MNYKSNLFYSLQVEVWQRDIEETVFPINSFIKKSVDHSAYIHALKVHVPNSGLFANVQLNRSSFPGTIAQRTDVDNSYNMGQYSTDPILIPDIDQFQISYDKRKSLLSQFTKGLESVIGNQTAYAWSPSASTMGVTRIIRTTGALDTTALASGATGSRSAVTLNDITNVKAILDNDNVPAEGRYLLMPWSMYNEILNITNVNQFLSYGSAILPSGVVNKLMGFNILCRPTVSTYLTGSTPVLQTIDGNGNPTATNTTDNMACLAWHEDAVSNAIGKTDIFYQENNPAYYGSIFSALVYQGAAKLYGNSTGPRGSIGVAAIVQQ
jgi:hypothetical protein